MGSRLPEYKVGQPTFVLAIGGQDVERHRLESMGIFPGAEIKLITKSKGGVLVAVGEARISLAADAAVQITVA
ncbi:MAG: ferrous iron transport protein A [Deltaproteobacteria bacterium]|jgi:Fe2+ transport system protein FeoA|nr:ferrous iron transport protein A [Deltaproteobacteria bacterium]